MKKHITNQKGTEAHAARSSPQQVEKIFDNAEELLRFDSKQTPVPPTVGERLTQSALKETPPKGGSWWSRLFGG
jgi:hypothetical protein